MTTTAHKKTIYINKDKRVHSELFDEVRLTKGLSRFKLTIDVELSPQTVRRVLVIGGDPRPSTVKKVGDYYDHTKDELKVGDTVRISMVHNPFAKEGKTHTFSREKYLIFDIDHTMIPETYILMDHSSRIIEGKFYRQELQKVDPLDEEQDLIPLKDARGKTTHFLGYENHDPRTLKK